MAKTPDSYVQSDTGNTKSCKVYCKVCLTPDVKQIMMGILNAVDQGRLTISRTEQEIKTHCESIIDYDATGLMFIVKFVECGENRGQVKGRGIYLLCWITCLNHLKYCPNQPPISTSRQRLRLSPQRSSHGIPIWNSMAGSYLTPG